jgi:membrane-bound serine protease (ClpP class)
LTVALALFGAAGPHAPAQQKAASSPTVVLQLDGAIQPASLHYLQRGLREARERHAALVVFELDTPGGLLVSLREMTQAIAESPVAVAVYVTPAGARAASAGFYVLLSADVAAMAPGTNTGAAHPVALGQGGGGAKDQMAKVTEDAAALARELAARRGRSQLWAERAVRESLSYTTEEARAHGLIDVVAGSRSELLRALDGRTVRRFDGSTAALVLRGPTAVLGPTVTERVLMVIGDPNVAYLLMLAGMLGLFIEIIHPGAVVPGVVGGVSLVLGLYSFSVLPVNWVGVLLIVLGLAFLAAEVVVTSYGLLTVAGLLAFVLGSLMLIDSPVPALRLGLGLIIPAALVLFATSLLLLTRAVRSRRARPQTGVEGMIGEVGEVVAPIAARDGEGKVFVHGEYWAATAEAPLTQGVKVRIEKVEGGTLRVAPIPPAHG